MRACVMYYALAVSGQPMSERVRGQSLGSCCMPSCGSRCCAVSYPHNMPNPSLRGWDVVTLPCEASTTTQQWDINSDGTVRHSPSMVWPV